MSSASAQNTSKGKASEVSDEWRELPALKFPITNACSWG